MADLFNNTSNNYIIPSLSACPGVSDDQSLQFLDGNKVGIIQGKDIIASISFDDLSIPITSFNKQAKILAPGEVTFIQGLTKGLCARIQGFTMPTTLGSDTTNPYFMWVDMSINYYQNFAYIYANIEASANYSNNVDIQYALDEALEARSISATATYDPSTLFFGGSQNGYEFNVSNVKLRLIDASENSSSPFTAIIVNGVNIEQSWVLTEDTSENVPYAKYPNTGMQGVILKGIYPTDYENGVDGWVYINHVTDYISIYSTIDLSIFDTSTALLIIFDGSTYIGSMPAVTNTFSVDTSTFGLHDVSLSDVSISSIHITESKFTRCGLYDVSAYKVHIDGSILDASVANYLKDTSVYSSIINKTRTINCLLSKSDITGSIFSDTTIERSNISDCSIINNSIINNDSSITNCYLQSAWTNTYVLLVNPSTMQKIFITEDESLSIDTPAYQVRIKNCLVWDSSINNALITDTSLYNSYIEDSSLVNCTTYNCLFDSSTSAHGSRDYLIDASIGCVFDIIDETSTYYRMVRKGVDVGKSGASSESVISAGDYLNWVTINSRWNKVGQLYFWTSVPDSADCTIKNLIDGFYVYNPHDFNVKIEYLVFLYES